ncbi:MAG TPA: Shedu anti-phage system protein SduA domain-containing protein [Tepidisphaeraceae bacterium]|nr:Shedu anti-phage system protein SduA domain-containing protein [Tepidisphaeraceae bacterium]
MKQFANVSFDAALCKKELDAFDKLLRTRKSLAESKHVRPFFSKSRQLSAFLGTYALGMARPNRLAYEFELAGDFCAGMVVGNWERKTFCMIEFEAGSVSSIFAPKRQRSTREWSSRFDHGFSQLVDWFYKVDDIRKTDGFARVFGDSSATFCGLLVIGRSSGLSEDDRRRLRWRSQHVLKDNHAIQCITYDQMYADLRLLLSQIQPDLTV